MGLFLRMFSQTENQRINSYNLGVFPCGVAMVFILTIVSNFSLIVDKTG